MLPLDSPRWAELKHAYGDAADIPRLLRELKNFPPDRGPLFDGPWHRIWSSLAHQGDVYSASFAAVPWVIHFLSTDPSRASWEYFGFPAQVEICRANASIEIPSDLEQEYLAALRELPRLSALALEGERDEVFLRSALSAIAVSKGEHLLAEAIFELGPEVTCGFMEWVDRRSVGG